MTAKMTKSAAALCGLTATNTDYINAPKGKMSKAFLPAQIRDNQAKAMTGHKMRTVIPR